MISLLKGEYLCKESVVMAFIAHRKQQRSQSCSRCGGFSPPPPLPRALGELHIKAYTEMLHPKGVPYVKLSFTSTS